MCEQGDISTLGRSEQYIRIISSVPRLKHRLELLLFKQQFPDITKRLEQSIHSVEQVNVAILHCRCCCCVVLVDSSPHLHFSLLCVGLADHCMQARLQIRDSKHLKTILKVILALGNYMNGGTRNGQAHGFQLDTLSKVRKASRIVASI